MVLPQGDGVIVKWGGQRDTGNIYTFESTTCIADLLVAIDSAVCRHLVASLRMSRSADAVNDDVAILGQGNKGLIFNHQGENLEMVLREAARFLKKESPAYVPPH
ncbi:hypothetical protein BJI69_06950 [Luteibacter rhizovicinus DSM 16549]|uniref:Uncharacterized protein n=1 Tax=Luteibacter rhizovicinus DSM 16549 TaxID=1440763 RepID=A0A0G9HLS7_9GAMM|nr:hypothetical protein [Luteibacter rhizovicinus]APG03667.1 hypothetical protein BJI69_06950 [Luteibacter rhizovicinus DSM 16549]KLD68617.1 hypothetical protein Y883_01055 [Luteibacter rhizovicinus DSM 16549]KLD75324.1 hypothetical protein Y886_27685 [Xanthomonas hyacinthi DSM 19077]